MRWLFLAVSIVSLLIFSTFDQQVSYHKNGGVESGLVTISGIAMGGKLCSDKCFRIYGANVSGGKTLTGQAVKKGGEYVLFVRRIE